MILMLEPSIDSLQEKINSKFTLVTVAARRARQLQDGDKPLVDEPKSHTYVGIALEEIDAGKIVFKEDE